VPKLTDGLEFGKVLIGIPLVRSHSAFSWCSSVPSVKSYVGMLHLRRPFSSYSVLLLFNSAPLHEDVMGSGDIAPRILILGTRWR
jgi:hypothetical protein